MKKLIGIGKGDWKAIAYCIFAAVTFWFINALNINYSIDVTHPLIVNYNEENYAPVEELPKEIRFSTTASGWEIFTKTNFINSTPVELSLDDFKKKRYITGNRLKGIVAKQMHGIQINEILDDTLYVNFEKVKTQKVRLAVDSKKVNLSEGYLLAGEIKVDPSEISISGPVSKIKKVPTILYIPIDEVNISGNYEEKISVEKLFNEKLVLSDKKVTISFESFQLEKVTKELNLNRINFPKKKPISISDAEVTLIYYAKEAELSNLEKVKFEAQLDYSSLNEKTKSIRVSLKNVPDAIKKYQFEPSTVKISYDK